MYNHPYERRDHRRWLRAAHAPAHDHGRRHLQPHVHAPRRDDGVAVPHPEHPDGVRQFRPADDDRGAGPGLPAAEPGELVSLHDRRHGCDPGDIPGRDRHRVDLLHALQQHLRQYQRHRHRPGGLHHRVLVDPHGRQLHRHDPQAAGPRYDLVPPAALRLDALRHGLDPGHRHAGHRYHDAADPDRAAVRCGSGLMGARHAPPLLLR